MYIYENKINNKKYIGITCNSLKTRSGHEGNGYKECTYFWNAIQKYGWYNFEGKIFKDNLTREEACLLEIKLIKQFKTQDKQYGYNISAGGDSGRSGMKYTDEQKKMLSENSKTVKKIICITTGEKFKSIISASRYYNISDSNIARACKNGIAAGEKNGEKLYWAYLNEDDTYNFIPHIFKRTREVICLTTNNFFDSMKEAAEYYNIKQDCIYQCCAGRNKSGGKLPDGTKLIWMYYDEYLKLNKAS